MHVYPLQMVKQIKPYCDEPDDTKTYHKRCTAFIMEDGVNSFRQCKRAATGFKPYCAQHGGLDITP